MKKLTEIIAQEFIENLKAIPYFTVCGYALNCFSDEDLLPLMLEVVSEVEGDDFKDYEDNAIQSFLECLRYFEKTIDYSNKDFEDIAWALSQEHFY